MTDRKGHVTMSPWLRLGAELPIFADSILLVGPGSEACAGEIDLSGAVRWNPLVGEPRPEGTFSLVVCAETIAADPHPANLLLSLWEAMWEGAALYLHARVLTDPEESTYARFGAARAGKGDTEWLPGRLALRWTIETGGFDFDRWIEAGGAESGGEAHGYLRAVRTPRTPALVLSTPVPVDGPGDANGGAS
jgi:hypothetical protein